MNMKITPDLVRQSIDGFWECIPPTWNRVRVNLQKIASENYSISFEQFTILRHIRRGIKSISELAEARHISRPAISQAVNMLVDEGLIFRRQSTEDRRWVELELTPKGNDILNSIFKTNGEWMSQKLARLSSDELHCLISGFEALKKTFED